MNKGNALLELSIMNAETAPMDFTSIVIELANRDVPMEIVTRLEELWTKTKIIAGEVVHIGRIIVEKIITFIRENPKMALGFAIGICLGVLTSMIPFIGPLLAPLATAIGIVWGTYVGRLMDSERTTNSPIAIAIEAAERFLHLLVEVFKELKDYWTI